MVAAETLFPWPLLQKHINHILIGWCRGKRRKKSLPDSSGAPGKVLAGNKEPDRWSGVGRVFVFYFTVDIRGKEMGMN